VKGGCTLAAISNFEAVCTNSGTPAPKREEVGRHWFYDFCLRPQYWLTGLSTKVEIEQEVGKCCWKPYVDSDDEGGGESGSQSISEQSFTSLHATSQSETESEDQDGEGSQQQLANEVSSVSASRSRLSSLVLICGRQDKPLTHCAPPRFLPLYIISQLISEVCM